MTVQVSEIIKVGEKKYGMDCYPLTNFLKVRNYEFPIYLIETPQGFRKGRMSQNNPLDIKLITNYLKNEGYEFGKPRKIDEHKKELRLFGSTACQAGYIGTWELRDNEMHLIGFESAIYIRGSDGNIIEKGIDLSFLFPYASSVKAIWFSGVLKIPTGKTVDYCNECPYYNDCPTDIECFYPTNPNVMEVEIVKGKVFNTTNKHYKPDYRTPCYIVGQIDLSKGVLKKKQKYNQPTPI